MGFWTDEGSHMVARRKACRVATVNNIGRAVLNSRAAQALSQIGPTLLLPAYPTYFAIQVYPGPT